MQSLKVKNQKVENRDIKSRSFDGEIFANAQQKVSKTEKRV